MRVLRVIPGLDATFGGPSESSVNACIASQRAGVETTVVVPLRAGSTDIGAPGLARLKSEGVSVITQPLLRFPAGKAYRWGISAKLQRWLKGAVADFDAVHTHSAWTFPTLLVLALSNGPPKVLTPHEGLTDFDVGRSGTPGLRFFKRLMRPLAIARTDHLVFSSGLELETSLAAEAGARDSSDVIYHPVFDERGPPPAPIRNRENGKARTLGFIGRFDPKKNLELALKALARLPNEFSLVAAGDGAPDYVAGIKRLAADLGVAGRVQWPGFVQGAEKEAFFTGIDALLMPSQFECFGMSAAEALARGVPVVVSAGVGAAPIVTEFDCGSVAERDPDAIAAAARNLVADRNAWWHHAQQAMRGTRARLSYGAHGAAQRACYEAIVSRRIGRPGP